MTKLNIYNGLHTNVYTNSGLLFVGLNFHTVYMKVDTKYIKWLLGNALACIKRVIITLGISLRALLKYKSCYKILE